MKYLKIYPGRYTDETRDTREMLAAKEAGFDVSVLCTGQPAVSDTASQIRRTDSNGFEIEEITLKSWRAAVYAQRVLSFARAARRMGGDVFSCHDITMLLAGYIASQLTPKARRPKLVYDAHEFEPGRNEKRSVFEKVFLPRLEKYLMKRCALNIVVNDTIADEYQRIYQLKERPLVVRSTPNLWQLDEKVITRRRKEITEKLGVPEDAFILMYHGGIIQNRGIESIIKCTARCSDIVTVIMGNSSVVGYKERMEKLAAQEGVSKRILFIPRVSPDSIWEYAGAASAGIMIISGAVQSYYMCLPNKFFENIQSETPIIASNFPEMKRLIDKYDIGLTCDPENLDEVCACINRMRDDKALYARFKENIKTAKRELCWENEKMPLTEALEKLIRGHGNYGEIPQNLS